MTNISKLTPEQRAQIRAHAERGDIDGVFRHLDCDGVLELLAERDEMRRRLRFIWHQAFLATQTALGPLDDLRKQLFYLIKDATRGKYPDWWKDEPDTQDIAGLEP